MADRQIWFYALCLNGKVLNMETEQKSKSYLPEMIFECHWKIEKIDFPEDWTFDEISKEELKDIIREAFTAESYSEVRTQERTKEVTVEIIAPID